MPGGAWIWYLYRRSEKYKIETLWLRHVLKHLSSAHELLITDEVGETLLTTHPHMYPDKQEFLKKIDMRIEPSDDRALFKKSVENDEAISLLLSGANKRFWLAHVRSLRPSPGGCIVSLTDCSSYLEPFQALKTQYAHMESFLDRCPFGLVYLNKSHNIIAINQTFSGWMGLSREQILGERLDRFLENTAEEVMQLRSSYGVSFPVLLFKSEKAYWFAKYPQHTISHLGQDNIFLQAPVPSVIIDEKGQFLSLNPSFMNFIKEIQEVDVGANLCDVLEVSMKEDVMKHLRQSIGQIAPSPFEVRFLGDKHHATVYLCSLPQRLANGSILLILQFVDISEQKRLERQFIQSQKMQAVGQLAGGIAHDFNNLLTAMIGFCDLLLQRYMPNDPSYVDIIHIKQNANRAATLVRQLLAFSRKQNLQPRIISLTDVLAELSALLSRLIGASIDFKMVHGRDLWPVKVDPSQLEQVIINLVVNARDAMKEGGTLIIRSSNYELRSAEPVWHEIMPSGDYAQIEVIDSGCGIPESHLDQIFEPFFSTKGAGTGLGLATVYGIIKQTGGFVSVESDLNHGSTFKIFLPRYYGEIPQEEIVSSQPKDLTGAATILLVEDEDAVRLFSSRALRDKGYTVLEARSGEEALELVKKGEAFDLLITDVVMPQMDGSTLSKKILEHIPEIKILFISGYAEETFRENLNHTIHFLPKPFTLRDLAEKVKDLINPSSTKTL